MALATDSGRSPIDPARVRKTDGTFIDAVRHFDWTIILRPRTILYMSVWTAVGLGLLFALLGRDRLEMNVLHDRNPQFVLESDGSIRNGYTIRLLNMIPERRTIMLSMEDLPEASMKVSSVSERPDRVFAIPVDPDQATTLKVFVTLPKNAIVASTEGFTFIAEDRASGERSVYRATFNSSGAK